MLGWKYLAISDSGSWEGWVDGEEIEIQEPPEERERERKNLGGNGETAVRRGGGVQYTMGKAGGGNIILSVVNSFLSPLISRLHGRRGD